MSIISGLLILTVLSGVAGTGLGGLLGALLKKESEKTMGVLLSFASGVMIALVCFDLIMDAVETGTSPFWIAAMILLGAVIVHLLNYLIDKKTKVSIETVSQKLLIAGIVMVVAIAFHNVPVGMTIGASCVKAGTAWNSTAVTMALLIGVHNVPEGMAIAIPLVGSGLRRWKAVLITAFGGVPIVIGALLGYFLGDLGEFQLASSLAFAGGAMLYVIFGEILPHAIRTDRTKLPTYFAILGVIVGMLITFSGTGH